jgi:hypothetical protein
MLDLKLGSTVEEYMSVDPGKRKNAWDYLLKFVYLSSSQFFKELELLNQAQIDQYLLEDVVNKPIMKMYMSTDNQVDLSKSIPIIDEIYKPTYGPVTYVGHNGYPVTTRNPVRIANLYMMLLDKIADTGSAVSTSRLNHFGFLSPVSGEERWADPIKKTPTKVIGATEARIYLAYTGRLSIAEMMDRYGNHTTQKTIVQNILNSAKPGAIDEIVDRNKNPFGQTKGMQLVRHFYNCRGTDLIYVKEK